MAANPPKKNNTLVIVLLLAFVLILGLVGVGVAALVIRQPALIGTLLAKVTGKEIKAIQDAKQVPSDVPEVPEIPAEPITAPPDSETPEPVVEEPVIEEPAIEEPEAEPAPEPEPPAVEPEKPVEKPAEKPAEKPVVKPAEKKPAEKKPATESTAGLNSGPRQYYIHIGKCFTPKEARELQADLNGRWSAFGLKQDSGKGLSFSFWKMGPREGADPKSFNNDDFCYQIRTGAITQKQAKHLQTKLKGIGHTAGIGKEA